MSFVRAQEVTLARSGLMPCYLSAAETQVVNLPASCPCRVAHFSPKAVLQLLQRLSAAPACYHSYPSNMCMNATLHICVQKSCSPQFSCRGQQLLCVTGTPNSPLPLKVLCQTAPFPKLNCLAKQKNFLDAAPAYSPRIMALFFLDFCYNCLLTSRRCRRSQCNEFFQLYALFSYYTYCNLKSRVYFWRRLY